MPTVSKTGAHSKFGRVSKSALVGMSMESMPSVSITMREQSLLNPTHEIEDPLLIQETDPFDKILKAAAS
jgi:hypothetical protein